MAPLPEPLEPSLVAELRAGLLAWYAEAARDLPWRRTRDPYGIWVSEVMLQQTRVEVVEERWVRFLRRFPTVADLARAAEDEVLAEWAGLGYYRRARSLHAAARVVLESHAGQFPTDPASVRALPGVGEYTTGAICSIAFDQPEALVDGNVERVFARLFLVDEAAASPALKRASWDLARALVPDRAPGDWNQALMELGATVCTPRAPRCADCPVSARCRALAEGRPSELPRPKVRRPAVEVEVELALALRGEEVLVRQRPAGGRMGGLWELPTREVTWSTEVAPGIHEARWPEVLTETGEVLAEGLRHGVTHHRIQGRVLEVRLVGEPAEGLCWASLGELAQRGLTALSAKALSKSASAVARLRRSR